MSFSAFGRYSLLLLGLVLLVYGPLTTPASARTGAATRAQACTTSWKAAVSGDWSNASRWDNGVPTGSSIACVTVSGTYTVSVEGSQTVATLTLGGSSGTQTLQVGSTCSQNAVFTTTGGFIDDTHGVTQLTNADSCGNSVTLAGPVTNAGTILVASANGGQRAIQGNFTNIGTLTVNLPLSFNSSGSLLSNQGPLSVANNASVVVTGGASFTNGAGGSITTTGNGVVLESSGTFTEGAGTTSGPEPVVVDDASLVYSGGGSSTIAVRGTAKLTGDLAAGQTLNVESTCSEGASVADQTSSTNAGTIRLTNGDGCGNNATLAMQVAGNTLTNSGTFQSVVANGGARSFFGNLTNTGTLEIDQTLGFGANGSLLTNDGSLTVASGQALNVNGGASFTNGGGSITTTGSGLVSVSGGTFTEGAGSASGSEPVVVDDGALVYTGTGASLIGLRGSSTLSGDIASGQTLSIESTCLEQAVVTAAASVTNAGTIKLTNGDGCGNNVTFALLHPTDALANSGSLQSIVANGGTRSFLGNLTNTGTLRVAQTFAFGGAGSWTLTNDGAVTIDDGKALTVSGNASFTNGAGGSITAAGSGLVSETGGTFTEGAGTTSGSKPVVLDDGTLAYTGSGASAIAVRGTSTLSGAPAGGQSLAIESTCSEHAVLTAAGAFTNAGTITLGNGDGCGNNATLSLAGGTLTNKGTLAATGIGGSRTLSASLANKKAVQIGAGRTLQIQGTFLQGPTGKLQTAIDASGNPGQLAVGSTATVSGTLAIVRDPAYLPTSGTLTLITGPALAGGFSKETGDVITGSRYFLPSYSGPADSIVVTTATKTLAPTNGHAGTSVHFKGASLPPNDTITITFKDFNGVVTSLGTTSTDGTGAFATDVTIPGGAALGKGKLSGKSTFAGVKVAAAFTVN